MLKIISDNTKFEHINYSFGKYTLKIEDKVKNFVRKLKNSNLIYSEIYSKLFCSGSSPGILYGLPKIHKPNFANLFQCRPIFAAYNTPCYNISKYLVSVLSSLATSDNTVENSYSFVSQLMNLPYNCNYFMASYDVSNLYTCVPLVETINIILNSLFSCNINLFIGLSREYFKTFLEIAVTNSFFIFNGELYRQRDGLGMGLPLAPTFANIFMNHHEQIHLQNCPNEFRPVFYKRYVDDTFVIFRHKDHAKLFLNYINDHHSSISFTMEEEIN